MTRANKMLEGQLADVKSKNENLANERSHFNEELRSLRPEHERLKSKLGDAQKNLEDETLKRIDLQNQLQTAQEEAKFNSTILTQQLNDSKTRKQLEYEEIDGKMKDEYEDKLANSLQVRILFSYWLTH